MRPEVLRKYGVSLAFQASLLYELSQDIDLYYDTLYRSITSVRSRVALAVDAAGQIMGHVTGDVQRTATTVPEPAGSTVQDLRRALSEKTQVGEAKSALTDKLMGGIRDWLLWAAYYSPEYRQEKWPTDPAWALLRYAQDLHRDSFATSLQEALATEPVYRPWEKRLDLTLHPALVEVAPTLSGLSFPFNIEGGDLELLFDGEPLVWEVPGSTYAEAQLCSGTQSFSLAAQAEIEFIPPVAGFNTYIRTAAMVQVVGGGVVLGVAGDFDDTRPGDRIVLGGSPYVMDLVISSDSVHIVSPPPAGPYINAAVHHSPVLPILVTCPERGVYNQLYEPEIALGVNTSALWLSLAFFAVDDPVDPVFEREVDGTHLLVRTYGSGSGNSIVLQGDWTQNSGAYKWASVTPGDSFLGTDSLGGLEVSGRKVTGELAAASTAFDTTMTPAQIVDFLTTDPDFSALLSAEVSGDAVLLHGLYPGTAGRLRVVSDFGYTGVARGLSAALENTDDLLVSNAGTQETDLVDATTTADGFSCTVPAGVDTDWVAVVLFTEDKEAEHYRISSILGDAVTTEVPVDVVGTSVQVKFYKALLQLRPSDEAVAKLEAESSTVAESLGVSGESAVGTTSKFSAVDGVHELDVMVGAEGSPHVVLLDPYLTLSAQLPADQDYSVEAWPQAALEKESYVSARLKLPTPVQEFSKEQLTAFVAAGEEFLDLVDSITHPPETSMYQALTSYTRGEKLVSQATFLLYGGFEAMLKLSPLA